MVKNKKIKKMIWTHGWVVFPVVTGRPLHYYWKGKKFQTEVVKKIIALDANHIVVEGEEKTYYRNLLGGLYRENPVKSRNYEAVKSSKKWENVGNSYIIPALLLYRYSYI